MRKDFLTISHMVLDIVAIHAKKYAKVFHSLAKSVDMIYVSLVRKRMDRKYDINVDYRAKYIHF